MTNTYDIFHPFASDELKAHVESSKELKALVAEMYHHFFLKAFCKHNNQVMLVSRNHEGIALVDAGVFWNEKAKQERMVYSVRSSYVKKERGRGDDRFIRKSENLKFLVRQLKQDFSDFKPEHETPTKIRIGYDQIKSTVESSLRKGSSYGSTYHQNLMTGDMEWGVLQHIFNDKPIDNYHMSKLKEHFEKHQKAEENIAALKQELSKFDRAHVITGSENTPIVYGVAHKEGDKYTFQGEVKPCFGEEDLPPEVAVHMKMHRISRDELYKGFPTKGPTPMHGLLLRQDNYDEDFETATYYTHFSSMVGTYFVYVFPYKETSDAN
jgi:hypothetical protein